MGLVTTSTGVLDKVLNAKAVEHDKDSREKGESAEIVNVCSWRSRKLRLVNRLLVGTA
jgi:hypothetical protein